MYDTLIGKVGNRFIWMLADEWTGIRARKWNSEKPLIFAPIILRKTNGVYKASDIRKHIICRLDEWEKENFAALLVDTIEEALANHGTQVPPNETEVRSRVFNSLLVTGRIREAVRYATSA